MNEIEQRIAERAGQVYSAYSDIVSVRGYNNGVTVRLLMTKARLDEAAIGEGFAGLNGPHGKAHGIEVEACEFREYQGPHIFLNGQKVNWIKLRD